MGSSRKTLPDSEGDMSESEEEAPSSESEGSAGEEEDPDSDADSDAAEQYSDAAAPSEVSDDDGNNSEDEQKSEAAVVESGNRSNAARAVPVPEPVSDGANAAQEIAMLSQQRRQDNIRAMLSDKLQVQRQPLVNGLRAPELALRRPFSSPVPGAPAVSQALRNKMAQRRVFVPWGGKSSARLPVLRSPPEPESPAVNAPLEDGGPPPGEPLVLWTPPEGVEGVPIDVDPILTRWLRPHQREGVQFIFECVMGLRRKEGYGCILADDMGLGKTLQGIALLWTMLQSGHELLGGTPIAKRIIIVCPTSLVNNWDSECSKWLKGRNLMTMPISEASREEIVDSIKRFLSPVNKFKVMIVSYETFRNYAQHLKGENACDLLICDEAHRLKNAATATNQALNQLACKRRVLLSGTPLQNNLEEFYAMVSFCNPGAFGSPAEFRRKYQRPILAGREPGSTGKEQALGAERNGELSDIVNEFVLRRTNALLSAHLPPKVVQVVCCRLSGLQQEIYQHFSQGATARRMISDAECGEKKGGGSKILAAITSLKKLCNHPKLIYDAIVKSKGKQAAVGFEGCKKYFLPGVMDDGREGRGAMALQWETLSGKFALAANMLAMLYAETNDRIVVVSNYTQTLDLFQELCRTRGYPFARLDGTLAQGKRQKLVVAFNDPAQRQFVFLLSSKAGGCGINLIGGNRLILFDPDWNPANDKQAAGRVWRDGQKKKVYVYRLLSTGTIEEKVFQRQLSKEGLQSLVNNAAGGGGVGGPAGDAPEGAPDVTVMSAEDLRDIFTLRLHTKSDTFDSLCGAKDEAAEAEEEGGDYEGEDDEHVISLGGSDSEEEEVVAMEVEGDAREAEGKGEGGNVMDPAEDPDEVAHKLQDGDPGEENLKAWGHHRDLSSVPDALMQRMDPAIVSFVFSCQVTGMPVVEAPLGPGQRQQGPMAARLNTLQRTSTRFAPRSAPAAASARLPLAETPKAMPAPLPAVPAVATPLMPVVVLGSVAGSEVHTSGKTPPSSSRGKSRRPSPLAHRSAPSLLPSRTPLAQISEHTANATSKPTNVLVKPNSEINAGSQPKPVSQPVSASGSLGHGKKGRTPVKASSSVSGGVSNSKRSASMAEPHTKAASSKGSGGSKQSKASATAGPSDKGQRSQSAVLSESDDDDDFVD